jgi:hypothetical protein
MKILVCDRCGFSLTEREDINLALEGSDAWQSAVRNRGLEPRGLYPCKHYMKCQGELILQNKKRRLFGH